MGDQEGLWPRSVTSIALRRGAGLRSPQVGRAYVIICGRGGLRSRGPYQSLTQLFLQVTLSVEFLFLWFTLQQEKADWFDLFYFQAFQTLYRHCSFLCVRKTYF
uniref:Uncharacterized protein n=1 Tax=Manihot esculenta TaxID=3983 RepID=A0A2C9VL24_MANES